MLSHDCRSIRDISRRPIYKLTREHRGVPTKALHPLLRQVGSRLRKAGRAKGLSQEALAHEANMDRSFVSGLERGEFNVRYWLSQNWPACSMYGRRSWRAEAMLTAVNNGLTRAGIHELCRTKYWRLMVSRRSLPRFRRGAAAGGDLKNSLSYFFAAAGVCPADLPYGRAAASISVLNTC
jgi:hypothetical protein